MKKTYGDKIAELKAGIMKLEDKDVVKYYISFSKNTDLEKQQIIKDYDAYLILSRDSEAGKIYQDTRKALKEKNLGEVKRLSSIARDMLANESYEQAPQSFDPKFIGNQSEVKEYRELVAKRDSLIPKDFKEALLD